MSKYKEFLEDLNEAKVKFPKLKKVKLPIKWSNKQDEDDNYSGKTKANKDGEYMMYYWNPENPRDIYWDFLDKDGESLESGSDDIDDVKSF